MFKKIITLLVAVLCAGLVSLHAADGGAPVEHPALVTSPEVVGLILHAIVKEGSVQDLNDFFLHSRKDIGIAACQALDSYGMVPIHYAALLGRADMVQALRDCKSANGLSAVAYAVMGVSYHTAMMTSTPLEKVCKNPVLCDRLHALSPLFDRWAAEANYEAVIEILQAAPAVREKLQEKFSKKMRAQGSSMAISSSLAIASSIALLAGARRQTGFHRQLGQVGMLGMAAAIAAMYAPLKAEELPLVQLLRAGRFDEAMMSIEAGAFCLHEVDSKGGSPMSYALLIIGEHKFRAHAFFKANFSRYLACGGPLNGPNNGPRAGFLWAALRLGDYAVAYFLLEQKVAVESRHLMLALQQNSPGSIAFVKYCLDSSLISGRSLNESNLLLLALNADAHDLALQLCDCGATVNVEHLVAVMKRSSVPLEKRLELFKSLLSRASDAYAMTSKLVREAFSVSDGEAFMEHALSYHQASYERFKVACPAKREMAGLKKAPSDIYRYAIADFVGVSPGMGVAGPSTDLYEESSDARYDDILCQCLNFAQFRTDPVSFFAKIRCLMSYYKTHQVDASKGLSMVWRALMIDGLPLWCGWLAAPDRLSNLRAVVSLCRDTEVDCTDWVNELPLGEVQLRAMFAGGADIGETVVQSLHKFLDILHQEHGIDVGRLLRRIVLALLNHDSLNVLAMLPCNFQHMVSLCQRSIGHPKTNPSEVIELLHEIGDRLRSVQAQHVSAVAVFVKAQERLDDLNIALLASGSLGADDTRERRNSLRIARDEAQKDLNEATARKDASALRMRGVEEKLEMLKQSEFDCAAPTSLL
ncbi:MAG: hypothetical protein QG604_648 [Candidatus Dependentiae bacterium]|nr:hypothetical protein [Candidatus Dependentiae bacterium]